MERFVLVFFFFLQDSFLLHFLISYIFTYFIYFHVPLPPVLLSKIIRNKTAKILQLGSTFGVCGQVLLPDALLSLQILLCRESLLSYLKNGSNVQVLGSLSVLAVLLQTKGNSSVFPIFIVTADTPFCLYIFNLFRVGRVNA